MIPIKPTTSEERKLLVTETIINTAVKEDGASRVSKISDHSVLSGIAGGVAKVSGKAEKDIILALSQLFPDLSTENRLDQVASNFGIGSRYGALGSSTYIRINATPYTQYLASTNFFIATNGVRFELEQNVTVGESGFVYAKVRSLTAGVSTNADPLTINKCVPQPSGHSYCINEYMATGGRDVEEDQIFRSRIKNGGNFMATGTLAMLEQRCIAANNKVLRLINFGMQNDGRIAIAVVTQNGAALTQSELDQLIVDTRPALTFNEMRPFGTEFDGLKYVNINFQPIDISFRAQLNASFSADEIRKQSQIAVNKYLDHRYFDSSQYQVQWDKLLQICQNIPGVDYIPDQYFYPRTDLTIDQYSLPRLRSFLILDLNGQVISNTSGTLSPIYYPAVIDESFYQTILA